MVFLAMQAEWTRMWLDAAGAGARAMTEAYAQAGRDATNAWLRLAGQAAPQAPSARWPFDFGGMPFAAFWPIPAGANWGMPPAFGALGSFNTPATLASFPLGFWAGISTAAEMNRQKELMDAAMASFRTAGGHAAAIVLAPFQGRAMPEPKRETPLVWWAWPTPANRYLS